MSTPATHPCDACGGTGEAGACGRDHGSGCCKLHNGCLCEQPWEWIRVNGASCPVCLGAGRFPDRMPVKDAVADAETLWLVSLNLYRDNPEPFETLERARLLICHAIADASVVDPLGRVKNAARAAFRAVPGLRVRRREVVP